MNNFYRNSKPKARKEHTCKYCGKKIHKGEIYSYEVCRYDGVFDTRKLCLACKNILDKFCTEEGYGEFDWYQIDEWLSDKYCFDCKHSEDYEDDCTFSQSGCPRIRKEFEREEAEGVKN